MVCLGEGAEPFLLDLKGTCSSGKSTLIRSLQKQKLNWAIVDEDAIMQESYVEAVIERFPEESAYLKEVIASQNLYHALREKEVLFQTGSSEEEREQAHFFLRKIQQELDNPRNSAWKESVSKEIDEKVFQKIEEAFSQDQPVLLDSWYFKPARLQFLFPKMKWVRVLLYCPLPVAYERLLKRNQEAELSQNLKEKRYLRQLIGSFCSMYRIDEDPSEALEVIFKEKWDECLSQMLEQIDPQIRMQPKPLFTAPSLSVEQFTKIVEAFFKPVENEAQNYFLHPKQSFDLVLDSTKIDLPEMIEKWVNDPFLMVEKREKKISRCACEGCTREREDPSHHQLLGSFPANRA